jgi:hypothetical protein
MNRRTFLTTLAGLGGLATAAPRAAAATWRRLGTRQVSAAAERDTIPVTAFRGRFDRIRLHVRGNDLYLYDLKVIYGNGAVDDIPVRLRIPQGGTTREIDLRGGDRFITAVSLVYQKPVNWRGPTWVEVWGRR